MPYVARIIARQNSREHELSCADNSRTISHNGILAAEFLRWLRSGAVSIPRMARNMSVDINVAVHIANALKRARKIRLTPNTRGVDVAELR